MALFKRIANKEFTVEESDLITRVCHLAKTTVNGAMAETFLYLPEQYKIREAEFLAAFLDIKHRAQRDAYLNGEITSEYQWPTSFPHCTPALRKFVNRWIEEELPRKTHAKCLILIGRPNSGKTAFAESLPKLNNYCEDAWNADDFNPYADYTIYENIPWDEFENNGYPDKKLLLLQAGRIHTMDSQGLPTTVDVLQPAIVLLRPEQQGSLNNAPSTNETHAAHSDFWSQNASVYRISDHESFY